MKGVADTLFVKPPLCKPPDGSLFRSPADRGCPEGIVFVLLCVVSQQIVSCRYRYIGLSLTSSFSFIYISPLTVLLNDSCISIACIVCMFPKDEQGTSLYQKWKILFLHFEVCCLSLVCCPQQRIWYTSCTVCGTLSRKKHPDSSLGSTSCKTIPLVPHNPGAQSFTWEYFHLSDWAPTIDHLESWEVLVFSPAW